MIPHNKPTLGEEEREAVREVIDSGWVASGKQVEAFERAFSKYHGLTSGGAVALSSGTAALYLALYGLRVAKGGEIIVPTYVCTAVLNAINMIGAIPVLVDIDPSDLNLSLEHTRKKLTKKTSAIVVTHTFGMPADVRAFLLLGVPIIEDCAQALGARIAGRPVGTSGVVSIFSFYASKMMTTGYGGMLMSADSVLIERVQDYRAFDGRTDYKPRFNFMLSDMQAAMGLVQLKRLPEFLARRETVAKHYAKNVALWPGVTGGREPNFYRMLVRAKNAAGLKKQLEANGVQSILPIEPFELLHRYIGQGAAAFPVAEDAATHFVSLPAYPSLTDDEVETIVSAVEASL
ncbi:MAG: GDP-perosamine synthase [Candidatus Parcubacteria bacterium]|jgi:perosamine synthetase